MHKIYEGETMTLTKIQSAKETMERKKFEKWYASNTKARQIRLENRLDPNTFSFYKERSWLAWLARAEMRK